MGLIVFVSLRRFVVKKMWGGHWSLWTAMEERKCTKLDCLYYFDRRIEEIRKYRRCISINGKDGKKEGILPCRVTCNCLLQDLCEVGRTCEAIEVVDH